MHVNEQKDRSELLQALDIVILALSEGTCHYRWSVMKNDNVGLLAQALTGFTPTQLHNTYIEEMISSYADTNPDINDIDSNAKCDTNWLGLISSYWPLNGVPTTPLFQKMHYAGLTRSEVADLEWLSNEEILQKARIIKKNVLLDVNTIELKGFFKKRYIYKKVRKQLHFYEVPLNVLKYLEAWRDIITEEQTLKPVGIIVYDDDEYPFTTIEDLENLKQKFIDRDQFEAIKKVDKEIEKLEKLNKNKK